MIIKYFCDYCGSQFLDETEAYDHEQKCKSKLEEVKKLETELLLLLKIKINFNDDKLFYHQILKEEQISEWLTKEKLNGNVSLVGTDFFNSEGFKELTELRNLIDLKYKEIEERSPWLNRLEIRDYLAKQYFEVGIKYV